MRMICSAWMDLTIEVRGAEKLKGNLPQVIVSNHQSAIDALVMSHVNPSKCAVMAKASLKWIPFFNVAALLVGSISNLLLLDFPTPRMISVEHGVRQPIEPRVCAEVC